MSNETAKWCCTSYKKEQWVRENGQKYYRANFMIQDSLLSYRRCAMYFWARRPILALREIASSGKEPLEFDGKEIN